MTRSSKLEISNNNFPNASHCVEGWLAPQLTSEKDSSVYLCAFYSTRSKKVLYNWLLGNRLKSSFKSSLDRSWHPSMEDVAGTLKIFHDEMRLRNWWLSVTSTRLDVLVVLGILWHPTLSVIEVNNIDVSDHHQLNFGGHIGHCCIHK